MVSVTQRIAQIKQPRGGYVPVKSFEVVELDSPTALNDQESLHPSTVGLVVDYLTRFMTGVPAREAFFVSLTGARVVGQLDRAEELLSQVTGLTDVAIRAASKLVGYDVAYRAGRAFFKGIDGIVADDSTVSNIRILVERSLAFFDQFGPVTADGFSFEGAYTDLIGIGDGDFLTVDTLWDFKVLKSKPTPKYTLQILVYYLMGKRTGNPVFDSITHIGIYNPRLNKVYRLAVSQISEGVLAEVSREVIGYDHD